MSPVMRTTGENGLLQNYSRIFGHCGGSTVEHVARSNHQ